MKWRPISELSDEQRDGRWWVFGSFNWTTELKRDENISFTAKCINEYRYCQGFCSWINDEGELLEDGVDIPHGDFFLSEPLPDLPKPLKMEWRRLRDEWPSNGELVFVYRTNPESNERHPEVCVCEGENLCHYDSGAYGGLVRKYSKSFVGHWMPIIPPEKE